MAIWSISLFQIISTLIGSGFTIFLLNSIAADINQPVINIDVTSQDLNQFLKSHQLNNSLITELQSNKTPDNSQLSSSSNEINKFETIVINNGKSPATNMVLQISYPQGKILDYYTSFQSENMSFQQTSPHLLVAKMERMPKDALMDIHTIVECDHRLNGANYTSFINDEIRLANQQNSTNCPPIYHIVTAAYDQGSIFNTDADYQPISIDKTYSLYAKNQFLIIIITLTAISFLMVFTYKRIQRFRIRLSRPKFVFNIVKEVILIRDTLQSNINAKKIFPLDLWFTKNEEEKLRIFSNYDDYSYLEFFYSTLNKRDEIMLRKRPKQEFKIDYETTNSDNPLEFPTMSTVHSNKGNKFYSDIKTMNITCLQLAKDILKEIDWKSYQDIQDKKYYTPISLAMSVAAAFLVSLTFEFYRVAVFQMVSAFPSPFYLFLSSILRGILFFILATEIINFKMLFSYEVGSKNNILSFLIMDRKSKANLFVLSLLLGSIPYLAFLTNFHPFTEEIYLFSTSFLLGYKLYTIAVAIDVIIFMTLILIVPKYILKEKRIEV